MIIVSSILYRFQFVFFLLPLLVLAYLRNDGSYLVRREQAHGDHQHDHARDAQHDDPDKVFHRHAVNAR
ncbi:MAG: hypothetical protein E7317_11115 [Clostridiales bacterium]|nr:hypothetical protein [Clostridiales bacterium]